MLRRHGVGAERARALAGPDGGVDPRLVEEPVRGPFELGGEGAVRVQDQLARLAPSELGLLARHRRHAVVVGEPVEPEHPRFERVPALWDVVPGLHRGDERTHRLVACLVVEVPTGEPVRVLPQTIIDGFVGQQGVEHERPRPQAGLERGRDRLGRGATLAPVGRAQPGQRLFEAEAAAVEIDRDRRRELAEQAAPRAAPRDRLLGHHELFGLGEEVGPVAPRCREVMTAEAQPLVGDELRGPIVGQRRPFELEEEDLRVDGGGPFLDVLEQRPTPRVGGVGREPQARVRPRSSDELRDRSQLAHDRGEPGGVELADGPAPLRHRRGDPLRLVEQLVDARFALAVDEGLEVPGDVGGGEVRVGRGGHRILLAASRRCEPMRWWRVAGPPGGARRARPSRSASRA